MENKERIYNSNDFNRLVEKLFGSSDWIECDHIEVSNEIGIDYIHSLFNTKTKEYAILGYTANNGIFYNVYARKTINKVDKNQKSKKSNKLKIFAGTGLIIGGLVGSLALYDANFDHTKTVCPFTHILGVQHQVNEINNKVGFKAVTNGKYTVSVPKEDGYSIKTTKKTAPKIRVNSKGKFEEYGENIEYYQEYESKITYEDAKVQVGPNEIMIIDDTSSEVVKKLVLK